MPHRVLICGDVVNDIVVKPGSPVTRGSDTVSVISARPGGSAANQAAWLAHLGVDVVFAGRCGTRDADFHRRELGRYGVDARIAADDESDTGSIVIMVSPDGERTMFTDRGANLRLDQADVPGLDGADLDGADLDGADLVHLTGYTFFAPSTRPVALALLGRATARGIPVTVDPGSAAFLAPLAPGEFAGWTRGCAVCFPNVDEAAVLTGSPDPLVMAARLAEDYPVVALKLGGSGCVLAGPGHEPVVVAAEPAEVVDTTGAGDAFCAAFLSRWLTGAAPREAAAFAARTAADAVTRLGGRPPAGP